MGFLDDRLPQVFCEFMIVRVLDYILVDHILVDFNTSIICVAASLPMLCYHCNSTVGKLLGALASCYLRSGIVVSQVVLSQDSKRYKKTRSNW